MWSKSSALKCYVSEYYEAKKTMKYKQICWQVVCASKGLSACNFLFYVFITAKFDMKVIKILINIST